MAGTKYSFRGWDFKTWLLKNYNNIKLIISGAAGLLTTFLSGLDAAWAVSLGTLVAALTKLLLDSLHYYVSE